MYKEIALHTLLCMLKIMCLENHFLFENIAKMMHYLVLCSLLEAINSVYNGEECDSANQGRIY